METQEPQRRRERGRDARQVQAHPVAGGGGENLEDRGGQARRGAEVEPHLGPLPVTEEIGSSGRRSRSRSSGGTFRGDGWLMRGASSGGDVERPQFYRAGLNIR